MPTGFVSPLLLENRTLLSNIQPNKEQIFPQILCEGNANYWRPISSLIIPSRSHNVFYFFLFCALLPKQMAQAGLLAFHGMNTACLSSMAATMTSFSNALTCRRIMQAQQTNTRLPCIFCICNNIKSSLLYVCNRCDNHLFSTKKLLTFTNVSTSAAHLISD